MSSPANPLAIGQDSILRRGERWYVVRNRFTKTVSVISQQPRKVDKLLTITSTHELALIAMDAARERDEKWQRIKAVFVVGALAIVIYLAVSLEG